MERSKERRQRLLRTPVTDSQLQKFLATETGKNSFVQRMAETLRQAWARIEELEGEPVQPTREEQDWQTRERVLVVSETDGVVEVFAEPWVRVKHLEVKPWDDRDEMVFALPPDFRDLDAAPKSRVLIVPQIRPVLDDKVLLDLLRWERRAAVLEELRDVIAQRT